MGSIPWSSSLTKSIDDLLFQNSSVSEQFRGLKTLTAEGQLIFSALNDNRFFQSIFLQPDRHDKC
jgi:hypothetical protein